MLVVDLKGNEQVGEIISQNLELGNSVSENSVFAISEPVLVQSNLRLQSNFTSEDIQHIISN